MTGRLHLWVSTVVLATTLLSRRALAENPKFGPFDVPTVFFISKSDDRNRVDYGIRLDQQCAPATDEPVFPYWREFERSPPVRTHGLGMFDWVAYGISQQRVTRRGAGGGSVLIKLKQVDRAIVVSTGKQDNGRCSVTATTTISGAAGMELLSVFVKLAGFLSVEYVKILGKNRQTGQPVEERLQNR